MDASLALKLALATVATCYLMALAIAWHVVRVLRAMHRDILHAAIDLHQVAVEQLAHQKALLLQGARPEAASGASEENPEAWLARMTKGRR